MSDYPEKIWMNIDYEDGGLMDWSSRQLSPAASEYIRADLVTRWQPIENLATTDRVILLYDTGHIESGWPGERDGKKYIMTGHGKIGLNRFTHFFIAPEMPK